MSAANILSVIVPVYNEEATITTVLDEVLARPETAEVIVIDDASKDKSRQVIEAYIVGKTRVKLLTQEVNRGKGAAIIRGFQEASAPVVIVQDADLEYSPEDFAAVIDPIIKGRADVVFGSRFQGGPGRVLYFRHQLGNKFLTFLSNLFTDLNLTDMETCYKAFRREVIQNINLQSERFGIEVELTSKIAKAKDLHVYEVPISYHGRTYAEGKKITWKDGAAAFWHVLNFNLLKNRSQFYKRPWSDIPPRKPL